MVRIELCEGLFGKVSVVNGETKEVLWEGKSGQTAEFAAEGEVPIEIVWGLLQTPNVKEQVRDGAEYVLIFRMTPFRAKYELIENNL